MKDRMLNALLAFFVFLLVFNIFLPQPKKDAVTSNAVTLRIASASLTVPEIPSVSVSNTTSGTVSFDTCKELEILKDYRKIEIDAPFQAFCSQIELKAGETKNLDLSALSRLFEIPGKYAFKLFVG
jgi:hypothetical protein